MVDRLVPKVVLATQTKVLEAAVDVDGTWVPSTPVIAVHAAPELLFRVRGGAAGPARERMGVVGVRGDGVASDAIKLSARQVLEIPLPGRESDRWGAAASALQAGDLRSKPGAS